MNSDVSFKTGLNAMAVLPLRQIRQRITYSRWELTFYYYLALNVVFCWYHRHLLVFLYEKHFCLEFHNFNSCYMNFLVNPLSVPHPGFGLSAVTVWMYHQLNLIISYVSYQERVEAWRLKRGHSNLVILFQCAESHIYLKENRSVRNTA